MAAVGVIARRRRSGAPTGSGDDVARGAWRCRGRCGIGSGGSCAWGAPPRRSARTSSLRGWRQAPCTETIYQAIYTGALEVRPSECLRTRRRRRRCRQGRNPPVAVPRAEHRRASRRRRGARGGGPLGGRSDHRRQQPVLDDLVDRTPKPLPDPDHHARRLRRRSGLRRPRRGASTASRRTCGAR